MLPVEEAGASNDFAHDHKHTSRGVARAHISSLLLVPAALLALVSLAGLGAASEVGTLWMIAFDIADHRCNAGGICWQERPCYRRGRLTCLGAPKWSSMILLTSACADKGSCGLAWLLATFQETVRRALTGSWRD